MAPTMLHRIVGGVTVLTVAAVCLTMTVKASDSSSTSWNGGKLFGEGSLQTQREFHNFVKEFYWAISSERLASHAELFFTEDASFHMLVQDFTNGYVRPSWW
eukprot:GHVS01017942.1.p1 GENE.GHVS01017942.1~~GHVS01017942.1.p1  ORF type:complete len:102 (-),score=15.78 GHVS01017942.1:22-327(-)